MLCCHPVAHSGTATNAPVPNRKERFRYFNSKHWVYSMLRLFVMTWISVMLQELLQTSIFFTVWEYRSSWCWNYCENKNILKNTFFHKLYSFFQNQALSHYKVKSMAGGSVSNQRTSTQVTSTAAMRWSASHGHTLSWACVWFPMGCGLIAETRPHVHQSWLDFCLMNFRDK